MVERRGKDHYYYVHRDIGFALIKSFNQKTTKKLNKLLYSQEKFKPQNSCDLQQRVKLRIGSLQGKLPEKDFKTLLNDELQPFLTEQLVHVSLEVYDDGIALSLPVFTRPISIQSRVEYYW